MHSLHRNGSVEYRSAPPSPPGPPGFTLTGRRLLYHRLLGVFVQYRHNNRLICSRQIDPVDADLRQLGLRCGQGQRHRDGSQRHSVCGREYPRCQFFRQSPDPRLRPGDRRAAKKIRYSSGPGISEFGSSIAADAAGNIYVTGGTVGDGLDVMTLKFNAGGVVQWRKVWDGAAFGPFSQDSPVKLLLDPSGNVLVTLTGYTASNHADYVVLKYAPADGAVLWEKSWGVTGDDFPADMEIDAAGDVYVTGIGLDFIDKYSTIKLRGSDGQLLWQFYDALGFLIAPAACF